MQSEGRKEEGKAVAVVFSARARSGLSGGAFALSPSLPLSLPLTQSQKQKAKAMFKVSFSQLSPNPSNVAQQLSHSLCGWYKRAVQ